MENTPLNVLILGDYALVLNGLRRRLHLKFGSAMHAEVFCDAYQCLKRVDRFTHVLVIDEKVDNRTAEEWCRQFLAINPDLEVLVHRNSDHVLQELRMLLHRQLQPEAASVFAYV